MPGRPADRRRDGTAAGRRCHAGSIAPVAAAGNRCAGRRDLCPKLKTPPRRGASLGRANRYAVLAIAIALRPPCWPRWPACWPPCWPAGRCRAAGPAGQAAGHRPAADRAFVGRLLVLVRILRILAHGLLPWCPPQQSDNAASTERSNRDANKLRIPQRREQILGKRAAPRQFHARSHLLVGALVIDQRRPACPSRTASTAPKTTLWLATALISITRQSNATTASASTGAPVASVLQCRCRSAPPSARRCGRRTRRRSPRRRRPAY